jgi:hypothetical protein
VPVAEMIGQCAAEPYAEFRAGLQVKRRERSFNESRSIGFHRIGGHGPLRTV